MKKAKTAVPSGTLRVEIITLSDRASRGEYPDRSGPKVRALLEKHFSRAGRRVKFGYALIPDDAGRLRKALRAAVAGGADVVVTTGGTGIGPRDITPDVVEVYCDRLIPGVMEYARVKFGARNPSALLSRSLAAVKGRTLVYCLPGSEKAVSEYVPEIAKTLEHSLHMLRGAGH